MIEKLRMAWHRRDIQKRIQRIGWTGIFVGDYSTSPTWAYTIGFHGALGAPEIIVFDLPQAAASNLFFEVYDDLRSGKLVIRDGERWRADEIEHPAVWRRVDPSRLYDADLEQPWLGLAEDFAQILWPGSGPIQAFQLVLSDHDGRLPWDTGYDERLRHRQRPLWEPPELAAANAV